MAESLPFPPSPSSSSISSMQLLAQLAPHQMLGIGVAVVLVIVTIAIFHFANKWEEADKAQLTDYSALMDNTDTADIMVGSTEKYEWSQGDAEMEVFINLTKYSIAGAKLRPKDIKVTFSEAALFVKIGDSVVIDGQLHGRILVEDSTWLIDEIRSSIIHKDKAAAYRPEDTDQVLWITLFKAVPVSSSSDFWPALLKGEKEVRRPKGSPPVHQLDLSDPEKIREAIKQASL